MSIEDRLCRAVTSFVDGLSAHELTEVTVKDVKRFLASEHGVAAHIVRERRDDIKQVRLAVSHSLTHSFSLSTRQ